MKTVGEVTRHCIYARISWIPHSPESRFFLTILEGPSHTSQAARALSGCGWTSEKKCKAVYAKNSSCLRRRGKRNSADMGIWNHINEATIIFDYQNIFGSKHMVWGWD
jgi:hypothetical protein